MLRSRQRRSVRARVCRPPAGGQVRLPADSRLAPPRTWGLGASGALSPQAIGMPPADGGLTSGDRHGARHGGRRRSSGWRAAVGIAPRGRVAALHAGPVRATGGCYCPMTPESGGGTSLRACTKQVIPSRALGSRGEACPTFGGDLHLPRSARQLGAWRSPPLPQTTTLHPPMAGWRPWTLACWGDRGGVPWPYVGPRPTGWPRPSYAARRPAGSERPGAASLGLASLRLAGAPG